MDEAADHVSVRIERLYRWCWAYDVALLNSRHRSLGFLTRGGAVRAARRKAWLEEAVVLPTIRS